MTPNLHSILEAYTAITGHAAPYAIWERRLYDWHKAGFNRDDMIGVLKWVMQHNRRSEFKYSLGLGKLLDTEHFSDLLNQAKAHYRRSKPATGAQRILKSWRGFEAEEKAVFRTVRDILAKSAS